MLLTIEKVAILKKVEIFRRSPNYALVAVANILKEIELNAGETFIEEGTMGSSMYVIVDGAVRVHSGGSTITELNAGQIVGELAVLDPEPRSASVTAIEDTLLFRIEKDDFDEIMADRPEIARSVIRILCRRLRKIDHYRHDAPSMLPPELLPDD